MAFESDDVQGVLLYMLSAAIGRWLDHSLCGYDGMENVHTAAYAVSRGLSIGARLGSDSLACQAAPRACDALERAA